MNIWRGHGDQWKAEVEGVTAKGYNVILSSPWYLNYISYAKDWPGVCKLKSCLFLCFTQLFPFQYRSKQTLLLMSGKVDGRMKWQKSQNLVIIQFCLVPGI